MTSAWLSGEGAAPTTAPVRVDVTRSFTNAVMDRTVVRIIDMQPQRMPWSTSPPPLRIEQVSCDGIRIGVCRSWLPDPRLAALNHALVPEAALLHMAAGITGERATIASITVSTRPAEPDDCADLDLSHPVAGPIVQVDTTWSTATGAAVLHSLARWRGDRVHLTLSVGSHEPERAVCPPSSMTIPPTRTAAIRRAAVDRRGQSAEMARKSA